MKRACFALWLKERRILRSKRAKLLKNKGLNNWGEMTWGRNDQLLFHRMYIDCQRLTDLLTKFEKPLCRANVFNRGKIEVSVLINNGQLSIACWTTLAQSNLHNFKLQTQQKSLKSG